MKPNFEFYVLNYDFNSKKVVLFNTFNNINVYNNAVALTQDYFNGETSYNNYVDELRCIIMREEWSRREYEISVGDAFETDINKLEKWDCYKQCEPNMEAIADMCIKRMYFFILDKQHEGSE